MKDYCSKLLQQFSDLWLTPSPGLQSDANICLFVFCLVAGPLTGPNLQNRPFVSSRNCEPLGSSSDNVDVACPSVVSCRGQRAANGGSDPSWLNLALLGRPGFPSRGPKPLKNRYLGTSGRKIGAPQKRQIQPRRI